MYTIINRLIKLPKSSSLAIECVLWLLQTSDSNTVKAAIKDEVRIHADKATLETVMFRAAFNMMELDIVCLTSEMSSDVRKSARTHIQTMKQQSLTLEGVIRLLKLLPITI